MTVRVAVLALSLVLAGCASSGGGRDGRGPPIRPSANPGAIVAAELGLARMAREQGQWAAYAEYAAPDAVMFVPEPVKAKDWLKGRASPAEASVWQTHAVWASCDGSLAVTRGVWQQPDGKGGYYTTVWQLQKNGDYKWVMDQGGALAELPQAPEMVEARIADCGRAVNVTAEPPPGAQQFGGKSADGRLSWSVLVEADCDRRLQVNGSFDGVLEDVISVAVNGPGVGTQCLQPQ